MKKEKTTQHLCEAKLRSSVRFLESRSGTVTTEFLGLASSWVSNEEGLVVLKEDVLKFSL